MTATMTLAASVFPRLYRDSVALLALASTLQQREHIVRAGVVMATPANLRLLAESDMLPDGVAAGPDDLLITVKGGDPGAVEDALAFASTALSSTDPGSSEVSEQRPQTIAEKIVEVGDVVNFFHSGVDVVLDPAVADRLPVVQDVAGPRVEVPANAARS